MQPDSITLAVDVLNNDTTEDIDFEKFDGSKSRSVYISENHSPVDRDTLMLYRGEPKQNGNFKGVLKTALKFSRDVEVEGVDETTTLKSPIITEVSFSVPLGATDADILIERQRVVALLDRDDIMVPLNSNQVI
jgi:hypothetical protein